MRTQTGLKKARAYRLSLMESLRMFDENFDRVFCAKRPWLRRPQIDPFRSVPQWKLAGHRTPQEVAKHYLAMDCPPRGTLKKMAEHAQLKYATLATAVVTERKRRKAA